MDVESPPPPDPRIGKVLQDRYRILSKVASGAMGVVYKGERVQLGRAVAIKFLHPWIAAQKAFLGRFENEAKAMSRLLHPHCVSVIDFGVDGAPYLVMDYVTGRTLREVVQEGRLQVPRALRLVQQLLAGLGHAHAQGIVHRDLKPENLMLSADPGLEEHLRILDFGLAKLRDGPAMTAGLAVGTPSYMSPEQSGADGAIDARTDLYTVGVVLFELLAGRKPFQSENVGELILMHREAPPPSLREAAPDAGFSDAMEALVHKAMSKLPEDRFQSASEMAAALDATPEAGGAKGRDAAAAAKQKTSARAPAKTTVDTVSAVRRRLGLEAGAPLDRAAPGAEGEKGGTPVRQWRLAWIGAAFLGVAMLALLIGRGLRDRDGRGEDRERGGRPAAGANPGSPPHRPAGSPPTTVPAAAAPHAGEHPSLEEARQLIARGATDDAIAVLTRVRAERPDDGEAPYLLAMLHFDHRKWADGIAAAQIAVRKNPTLKSDPDLIKGAIRALVSDNSYERAQSLLRSCGQPAVPFIKEAAARDPSPKVRERAAQLLGGGRGWPSRPSPPPSGGVFRR